MARLSEKDWEEIRASPNFKGVVTLDDLLGSQGLGDLPAVESRAKRRERAKEEKSAEVRQRHEKERSSTANLIASLELYGIPAPRSLFHPAGQYRFHMKRRWRFDLAWPAEMLAVELQGIGSHTRPYQFNLDAEKLCTAMSMGWTVFPATHKQVRDGTLLGLLVDWWDRDAKRSTFRQKSARVKTCGDT